jgi:flagellar L-ring protein precursor FlgH
MSRPAVAMLWALALGLAFAHPASSQTARTAADSVAAAARAKAVARAAWLSDRMPLRPGDILTVVVDEQTAAREKVSRVAVGDRSQQGRLRLDSDGDLTRIGVETGMDSDSRDVGEASRQGDLTAVMSVRVKSVAENGVAEIEGSRRVSVDGRLQEIALHGFVRPEDVSTSNLVLSNRIAEAVITFKGKKIGPRTGIVGKILSILWP